MKEEETWQILGNLSDGVTSTRPLNAVHTTYGSASSDIVIESREIRRAWKARRLRDRFFGEGLFEEPAWDMLLDLFAAELERRPVSVSKLCIAGAVAPTTALRWVAKLTDVGLFDRTPDQFDRRKSNMAMSESGSLAMRRYIAALRREGLSLS